MGRVRSILPGADDRQPGARLRGRTEPAHRRSEVPVLHPGRVVRSGSEGPADPLAARIKGPPLGRGLRQLPVRHGSVVRPLGDAEADRQRRALPGPRREGEEGAGGSEGLGLLDVAGLGGADGLLGLVLGALRRGLQTPLLRARRQVEALPARVDAGLADQREAR